MTLIIFNYKQRNKFKNFLNNLNFFRKIKFFKFKNKKLFN